MKHKKAIIDTYQTIYNKDLVVCNAYVSVKQIIKRYTYCDGKEIQENDFNDIDACCMLCIDKNTKKLVEIIYLCKCDAKMKDKAEVTDIIAHESVHAAMDIYNYISASVDLGNQEPFAYLVGYIANCVYKTYSKI